MNFTSSFTLVTAAVALFSLSIVFTKSVRRSSEDSWTSWDFVGVVAAVMAVVCMAAVGLTIAELAGFLD